MTKKQFLDAVGGFIVIALLPYVIYKLLILVML
jgi:hypothetical protein